MKKINIIFTTILCLCFFTACSNPELEQYNNDMSLFCENMSGLKESMEAIDTNSDSSTDEMLSLLNDMEAEFKFLSEMNVPKEFASNKELGYEAYEYMKAAVRMYTDYYSGSEPNDSILDAANENYSRAMKRVNYISLLLQGEMPTDDDISVTEENAYDFTPVTDSAGDINNE